MDAAPGLSGLCQSLNGTHDYRGEVSAPGSQGVGL